MSWRPDLVENLHGRVDGINAQVLHEGGETLVEIQVIPPLHSHQVPKPLVTNLVSYQGGNLLQVLRVSVLEIGNQPGLPASDLVCSLTQYVGFSQSRIGVKK